MTTRPQSLASPPCMADAFSPERHDPLTANDDEARDIARWRKIERARLLNARRALPLPERSAAEGALREHLHPLLEERLGDPATGAALSAYWPIKGEPDLRPLMASLHAEGATIALPLVERKAAPLTFRRWTPQTRLMRGDWGIPVPPPEAAVLAPSVVLAPLVGWDGQGYRLGHGGGYFDRTLAVLDPRPFTIGIGFQQARLHTIHPLPHDIGLDAIVTEAGLQFIRKIP